MKLYAHGPRRGKTFKLRGLQFVDGVCEHHSLSESLKKFYNIQDYPPNEVQKEDVQSEKMSEIKQSEEINEEFNLNKVVQELKDNLQTEKLKSQKDFKNFGSYKAYVKEKTGLSPRTKIQANSFMKEYAEQNNLEFEE